MAGGALTLASSWVRKGGSMEGDASNRQAHGVMLSGRPTALTLSGTVTSKASGRVAWYCDSSRIVWFPSGTASQSDGGKEVAVPLVVDVLVPSTTTLTYKVGYGASVESSSVSVFRLGAVYTKPSTIDEIVSVSIDGRELAIYTESELNAAASSRGGRAFLLESSMGFHPNAFSSVISTVSQTPKWREQHGPVEAVVFNNRTSSTFRIYPLPKEGTYTLIRMPPIRCFLH